MYSGVLIPLMGAVLFLLADVVVLVKLFCLMKKHKNQTVEELSKEMFPLLKIFGVCSVLLAVCMILTVVFR